MTLKYHNSAYEAKHYIGCTKICKKVQLSAEKGFNYSSRVVLAYLVVIKQAYSTVQNLDIKQSFTSAKSLVNGL